MPSSPATATTSNVATAPPLNANKLDAGKILADARALLRRMVEDNRPKIVGQALKEGLIAKDEIAATKENLVRLALVPSGAAEAKKLLAQIEKAEVAGKAAMKTAEAKWVVDDVSGRKDYAKRLEGNFLNGGFDVTVTAVGVKATTLKLSFVLFSRPFVYKLTNDGTDHETELVTTWRSLGFKKAVFADGYGTTWTLKLDAR